MVWDVSYTCDICNRKKSGSNHWWMLALGDVPCFEPGEPRHRFTLMPWNQLESGNTDFFHLCGRGCAIQAMERYMHHGNILPEGFLLGSQEDAVKG